MSTSEKGTPVAKKKPTEKMTPTAFGRWMGVSHTAVQKAIASGLIDPSYVGKNSRGQNEIVDPEGARESWDRAAAPTLGSPRASASKQKGGNTLAEAKLRTETYKGMQAKLDYETKAGNLAEVAQVNKAAFAAGRQLRDALTNIPARISGHLASLTDPFEVEQALLVEITQALDEITKTLGEMKK